MLSRLQDDENRQGNRINIEPQTFCYLKDIEQRSQRYSERPNSEQQLHN